MSNSTTATYLSNTTPRPMQKRQKRKIATRTPTRIHLLHPDLPSRPFLHMRRRIKPALWLKLLGIGAPKFFVLVQRADAEDDGRAFGDDVADDGGGARGYAEGHCDGGVQAQDFETEGVQVGDVVDDVGSYGHVCCEGWWCIQGAEVGVAEGGAKASLNGWVAAEGEESPLGIG